MSPADQAEIQRHNAGVDRRISDFRSLRAEVRRQCVERLGAARLASLPAPIRSDVGEAIRTPAARCNEVQKYLAAKFEASLTVKPEEVTAGLWPAEREDVTGIERQIREAESKRRKWGKLQALYDVGPPPPTHLLIRGSERSPGAEVPPGFLRVLSRSETDAVVTCGSPYEGTSGRRRALARWLTEPGSPALALAARVIVNRIWTHLFGQGIVSTADNFGAEGQRPTHPELLEWRAASWSRTAGASSI